MIDRLSRWGFEPARISFALRTALAAAIALWLAKVMGLQHPQWAAMSVWAAAQPLRGQLLEKSLFRLLGTVVGTGFGILLALLGQIDLSYLVAGLALWVGLCTGVASLWRGYLSYGGVLAGYSAGMVSLLDIGHPEALTALGLDRLATVLTGVLVVTLVGLPFAPKGAVQREKAMGLLAEGLRLMAGGPAPEARAALLARIAEAEEGLDSQAAGSRHGLRVAQAVRGALLQLTAVLLATPQPQGVPWAAVAQAAEIGDWATAARILDMAGQGDLAASLRAVAQGDVTGRPALHRDWIGAAEAGLRATLGIAAVGAIWIATGFSGGNFMLLGLTVMISVFAAMESPVTFMRHVVIGQTLGLGAMLVLRWGIWPFLPSDVWLVPSMVPFLFLGAALIAHRKTVFASLDANMCFLLLLQPIWPLSGTPVQSLTLAGGVLSAPLMAWALYWLVFPANLPRRIAAIERMMAADLARMAASHPDPARLARWHTRLHHRVIRLLRLGERAGRGSSETLAVGVAHLRAEAEVLVLQARVGDAALSEAERLAAAERLTLIAAHPADAVLRAA